MPKEYASESGNFSCTDRLNFTPSFSADAHIDIYGYKDHPLFLPPVSKVTVYTPSPHTCSSGTASCTNCNMVGIE